MAQFFLQPYIPETNKFPSFYVGADGWMYNDLRIIVTTSFGSKATTRTQTSTPYFEPYIYKNVVYLKFCPRPGQGFEDYYLSVDNKGQLGLYKWIGATGWKLDFEGHLVSIYNGCNVALAGDIYKADNAWPGLRFRKEENPELYAAMNAYESAVNSLDVERTPTYGGTGGTVFGGALPKGAARISKLLVRAGDQINALTASYCDSVGGNLQTLTYGGTETSPGTWNEIALAADEYINEVQGRADKVVRQLTFKTTKGRTFGPYGPAAGTAFSATGRALIGFFGKCGTAIDQLGFMRLNCLPTVRTPAFGGPGGNPFDCTPPPGAARIAKLNVHAGGQINTISVDWWDAVGGPVAKASAGGAGQYAGTWYECCLLPGQYITEISGMADTAIRQISFKLNNGYTYGPYGTAAGTSFRVSSKEIVGFYGRGGWGIDQLGFVVIAPPAPRATAALEFNGVDTYVVLDAPLPFGPQVTLELWARGVPKEAHLFWLTDAGRRRQLSSHAPWTDGNIYFDAAADANNSYDRLVKSALPHDPNAWNHWAFVRNATTGRMAIYKNGVLFYEFTASTRLMASCDRFVLGGDGDGNGRYAGAMSEVRLWSVERTAAQIKDNMSRVLQGPDTGLVLSWSLDGIQADKAIMDGSGSGRHGTLTGALKAVTPPAALAT